MFDSIVESVSEYPYLGVMFLFLMCGLGLPLPEELILIAGGYICAKWPENARLGWMMVWSATAILVGDLLPYVLGRVFGARVLRIRWLRITVTRRRLAKFDRWFRQRGDLVIFIARFLAGIRVIAFFTAGMMKMPWRRFLMLDGLGIVIIVPLMIWIGNRGAGFIDHVIGRVQAVERGILWSLVAGLLIFGIVYAFWRRGHRRKARPKPVETYVEPQLPVQGSEPPPEEPPAATPASSDADAQTEPKGPDGGEPSGEGTPSSAS